MQVLEGVPRVLLPREEPASHLGGAPQVTPPADRLQGLAVEVQLQVGAQEQREVQAGQGDAVVRPRRGSRPVLGVVGAEEAGEVAHARDACAAEVGGRVLLLEAELHPLPACSHVSVG